MRFAILFGALLIADAITRGTYIGATSRMFYVLAVWLALSMDLCDFVQKFLR